MSIPMTRSLRFLLALLLTSTAFASPGCSKPLGILQRVSDGAESLSVQVDNTVQQVHDKADAAVHRVTEVFKDIGDDLSGRDDDSQAGSVEQASAIEPANLELPTDAELTPLSAAQTAPAGATLHADQGALLR